MPPKIRLAQCLKHSTLQPTGEEIASNRRKKLVRPMSQLGQNAKYSEGADDFRLAPMNGHHQARLPCRKRAIKRLMQRSKLPALFDHLVGAGKQRWWNGEAERSCGLEVNHQLEPCRLLHRQLTRFAAVQNLRDLLGERGSHLAEAGPV